MNEWKLECESCGFEVLNSALNWRLGSPLTETVCASNSNTYDNGWFARHFYTFHQLTQTK